MAETYEALSGFARSAGTLYCFAFFLGVLVYALWPSNREKFNKAAQAPLSED
jgi:cytochrome c oxidase cbb3-type subunit IV